MAILNEDFLRRNGVTQITAQQDSQCVESLDGSLNFVTPPKYSVTLELDQAGLVRFGDALAAQENLDEMTEFKKELATMHAVNACPGGTLQEKIDHYLETKEKAKKPKKNVKVTNPQAVIRYKLKYR